MPSFDLSGGWQVSPRSDRSKNPFQRGGKKKQRLALKQPQGAYKGCRDRDYPSPSPQRERRKEKKERKKIFSPSVFHRSFFFFFFKGIPFYGGSEEPTIEGKREIIL